MKSKALVTNNEVRNCRAAAARREAVGVYDLASRSLEGWLIMMSRAKVKG
jgi:hypothetical protein